MDNDIKTQEQIDMDRAEEDSFWEAFLKFDVEQLGYIQTINLKEALSQVGEVVNENENNWMISQVDP